MVKFSVPLPLRRGVHRGDEETSVHYAGLLLKLIEQEKPLAGARILDYGCGVKLVQALVETDAPIRKYVGIDNAKPIIDFLVENNPDRSRFEFGFINMYNEMYNKDGDVIGPDYDLPITGPDAEFGIITMFSVITHLKPEDADTVLRLLRRYAAPECRLIFSTHTDPNQEVNFIDGVPERPMLKAVYRPEYLERIVENAGWNIRSSNPGIPPYIVRHYWLSPAEA